MLVLLIVLVGLGTIAGLTVITVQGGSATTSTQRFDAMALYAAESGAAVTMDFLRDHVHPSGLFSAFVSPSNSAPQSPAAIPGNGVHSGAAGNLLSNDQRGWYSVLLLNNRADDGYASGVDSDGILIIRVTGHGPNGAVSELEWEVRTSGTAGAPLTLVGWREVL